MQGHTDRHNIMLFASNIVFKGVGDAREKVLGLGGPGGCKRGLAIFIAQINFRS